MSTLTSLLHLAILGSMTLALHAAPIVTVNTLTDENDGVAAGGISLRDALAEVDDGGQIKFNSLLSGKTIKLLHGEMQIVGKSIHIDASSLTKGITIDGDATSRAFLFNSSALAEKTITFSKLSIKNCHDAIGGAIQAIGISDGPPLHLILNDCHLTDNYASHLGGAIASGWGINLSLNRCSFISNSCDQAAGVINSSESVTATNCTFACNHSGGPGAVAFLEAGNFRFNHCTITENTSTDSTPSVFDGASFAHIFFCHTICSGNLSPNVIGVTSSSLGYNIFGEASPTYATATDILTNEPKLELPMRRGGNTFTCAFRPNSPACNAGDPNINLLTAPTTDQRGYPRLRDGKSGFFFDNTIDIGAYELGETLTVTTAADENFTLPDTGLSLREAIVNAATNGPGTRIALPSSLPDISQDESLGSFEITSDLWIDGSERPGNIAISGGNGSVKHRNVKINPGVCATLEALKIYNGIDPGLNSWGGGCILADTESHINLIDSELINGEALLDQGFSGIGGGLSVRSGSGFLLRCSIHHCSSDFSGGAVFVEGSLHAVNTSIFDNQGNSGGAIRALGDSDVTLEHCTIFGNLDSYAAGGALVSDSRAPTTAYTLWAGNFADFVSAKNYVGGQPPRSLGYNVDEGTTLMLSGTGDQSSVPPSSINLILDHSSHRVTTLAPNPTTSLGTLIDVGPAVEDYTGCYRYDQSGAPRIKSFDGSAPGRVDIGAMEATSIIKVNTSLDENNGPGTGEGTSLREAVILANSHPDFDIIEITTCNPIELQAALGGELYLMTKMDIRGSRPLAAMHEVRGPKRSDPAARFRVFRISGDIEVDFEHLTIADGHINSGDGGGILVENGAELDLTRCHITGCSATNGGGLATGGTAPRTEIYQSSFSNNVATTDGGAFHVSTGPAPFYDYNIRSSTFTGNFAAANGGAIRISGGAEGIFEQNTISENYAASGGGVSTVGVASSPSLLTSIVAKNTPNDLSGTVTSGENIYTDSNASFVGDASSSQADPLLLPFGDYGGPTPTMALSPTSLAIDYLSSSSDDQRDVEPADGDGDGTIKKDVGAFEAGQVITVTTTMDEDAINPGTGLSLREAIAIATPGTQIKFDSSLNGTPIVLDSDLEIPATALVHIIGNGSGLTTITDGGTPATIIVRGYAEFRDLQFFRDLNLFIATPAASAPQSHALVNRCHFPGDLSGLTPIIVQACSQLQVFNTTFEGTSTTRGAIASAGRLLAQQCTFSNNFGIVGGGIAVIDGEAVVKFCSFYNNRSSSGGTAFIPDGGSILVSHCAFEHPLGVDLVDAAPYLGTVTSLGGNYSRNVTPELNHPTDQVGDPKLGPLNGGLGSPPIHVPRIDSPLIDAIALVPNDALRFDPRGYRRPLDGNGDGFGFYDIGAVEAPPVILVDTELDENDGIGNGAGTSLRDAVDVMNNRNYAEIPIIGFAQHLDGARIQLESSFGGEILLSAEQEINADALANGITIAGSQSGGGGDFRVFQANAANESIYLRNLTIEQGFATDWGGGLLVENATFCSLTDCTVRDNLAAQTGGGVAVRSSSFLGLERSTLSGNRCDQYGGGLGVDGSFVQAINSTISGNHAIDGGGGIADITLSDIGLEHCTIANNTADNGGGGIDLDQASVRASHTILAQNTPFNYFGRSPSGDITSLGHNLDDGTNGEFTQLSDLATVPDAKIGPLSDNGGRTQTHALLYGSLAIDSGDPGIVSTGILATDQSGFRTRVQDGDYLAPGTIDIGAFELDLSTLPPDMDFDCIPNGAEVAMGFNPQNPADGLADQDGDLVSAGKEWLAGTNDSDPTSKFKMISVTDITGHQDEFEIIWSSVNNPDVTYDLELTEDGHNWILFQGGIPATGPVTIQIVPWISATNNLYFRVSANRIYP